jgi:RNA ligase (TIGR02306 family)
MSAPLVIASERKLAQVARVAEVSSILVPNSDPPEYASNVVLVRLEDPTWQCVALKVDGHQVGDLVIYFAIDSVLDNTNPAFHHLKGKRLKTVKMLGQLSQGLIAPLDSCAYYGLDPYTLEVGQDLTQALKVEKYAFKGDEVGEPHLPPGVRKTHENRVQECKGLLRELARAETEVIATRKEDGTSTSFVFTQGEYYVCGHRTTRVESEKQVSHYFEISKRFQVESKLRALGRNLAVQGEIVGVKINGNTLKFPKGTPNDFRVFYIWDIDSQRKLSYNETDRLCRGWGFNRPPIVYRGRFKKEWENVEELLKYVETLEYAEGVPAEGMVVSTDGEGVPQQSFKVISNKWLLATGR